MRLEYQIIIALGLDMLLGDPRWLPHPVRFIGRFAVALEDPLRRTISNARMAGLAAALLVIAVATVVTHTSIRFASLLHPWAGDVLSIYILYSAFAARDLTGHVMNVHRALSAENLPAARQLVSLMVGRDTAEMDKSDVTRAAVESVAENTVDGVVAPLFFAVIAGPAGTMFYKAINTLDSTFGYRNEKYIEFGWASAKIDDWANYIPARITAPFIMLAALPWGGSLRSFQVCCRDGRRHLSPNAGLAEASMAGALGIQLGGPVRRSGIMQEMPLLGAPAAAPEARHICLACVLMLMTTFLAATILIATRFCITALTK